MNFFKNQFRKMFAGREEFDKAKFIGRAAYIPLDNGLNIKAEFITHNVHDQWTAILLSTLNNGKQGDAEELRFEDFLKPVQTDYGKRSKHIWSCSGVIKWTYAPSELELQELTDQIAEYTSLFDIEQNQYCEQSM